MTIREMVGEQAMYRKDSIEDRDRSKTKGTGESAVEVVEGEEDAFAEPVAAVLAVVVEVILLINFCMPENTDGE